MGRVIPPYPHADGIDLGEEPAEMDPERDPHERLPGKKARRAMAEERAARREERTMGRTPSGKAAAGSSPAATTAGRPRKAQAKRRRHPGDHGGRG